MLRLSLVGEKKIKITLTISFLIALNGLPAKSICFKGSTIANSAGRPDKLLFETSSLSREARTLIDFGSEFN